MSKYRIRYSFAAAPLSVQVMDLGATGPIQALNQFHAELQVERHVKPESYTVISLAMIYAADANHRTGADMVESNFDLPKSNNPNLVKAPEKEIKQDAWF